MLTITWIIIGIYVFIIKQEKLEHKELEHEAKTGWVVILFFATILDIIGIIITNTIFPSLFN